MVLVTEPVDDIFNRSREVDEFILLMTAGPCTNGNIFVWIIPDVVDVDMIVEDVFVPSLPHNVTKVGCASVKYYYPYVINCSIYCCIA